MMLSPSQLSYCPPLLLPLRTRDRGQIHRIYALELGSQILRSKSPRSHHLRAFILIPDITTFETTTPRNSTLSVKTQTCASALGCPRTRTTHVFPPLSLSVTIPEDAQCRSPGKSFPRTRFGQHPQRGLAVPPPCRRSSCPSTSPHPF